LTDNNLAVIKEMKSRGFNPYELAKVADVEEEEE
jgi:hypothetical protein